MLDDDEHPIHLHGHRFWIVAGARVPNGETINRDNFVVRDTAQIGTLKDTGNWLKIRFVADHPGIQMIHCHMVSHMVHVVFALDLTRAHAGPWSGCPLR